MLQDGTGRILGVMPLYLKSHSYGEYVFDHAWADAYERAGGQYYPKLLSAVPFTLVQGPRLLVRPGEDADASGRALAAGMVELVRRHDVSSAHVNFVDPDQASLLEDGLYDPPRAPVPLAQPRLRGFRRFLWRPGQPQAQSIRKNAAGSPRPASRSRR